MPTEFADPQVSLRMLENAIAASTWSFILLALMGAAIAFVYIVWECAARTRKQALRANAPATDLPDGPVLVYRQEQR